MPGSTSRRDQREDPRDNTVDLPRIDVDGLTDYFRRAAPMLEPEPAGLLEPLPEHEPAGRLEPLPGGLRHPYAEANEPRPSASHAIEPPAPAIDEEPASASASGTPARPAKPDGNQVAPTSAAVEASAPALLASNRGAVDLDVAALTAAAPSSEAAASASSAEPTTPGRHLSKPAADASARTRADALRSGGRAPAGSLADLRTRLARLPDGHPSSPYEDGGHARPVPIRLRQLELGLPAPGREVAAGVAPVAEAADSHLTVPQESAEPEAHEREDDRGARAAAHASNRDAAEAEHIATEVLAPKPPDILTIAEPAAEVDSEPARPSGSSPATPESADPYAGAGDERLERTSAEPDPRADLTLGPWRATPSRRVSGLEGLGPRGANGHGPANGHRNGSRRRDSLLEPDRADRAADRRDTAEYRIAEPPGRDVQELVERMLATSRTAEGRNVFGSYGSSGLTPMMQRMAAHLPFGGLAPDCEANSLKSSDRLKAKLARLVTRNPGRTAEELATTIGDVVRYAFVFEAADYVEGTWLVHRRLKSHGFELELRRNRWESPEYKGIFTQWRDPAHHIAFEVQFHTTASWTVVQRTHEAYVQITDPATPAAERSVLRARQVAAAAAAKAPPNWAELGDFRLEAR